MLSTLTVRTLLEGEDILGRQYLNFGSWLTKFDWSFQFNIPDFNDKVLYFAVTTWKMIEKYFPMTEMDISNTAKEWMTPLIKKWIKQRQNAYFENNFKLRDFLNKAVKIEIM